MLNVTIWHSFISSIVSVGCDPIVIHFSILIARGSTVRACCDPLGCIITGWLGIIEVWLWGKSWYFSFWGLFCVLGVRLRWFRNRSRWVFNNLHIDILGVDHVFDIWLFFSFCRFVHAESMFKYLFDLCDETGAIGKIGEYVVAMGAEMILLYVGLNAFFAKDLWTGGAHAWVAIWSLAEKAD